MSKQQVVVTFCLSPRELGRIEEVRESMGHRIGFMSRSGAIRYLVNYAMDVMMSENAPDLPIIGKEPLEQQGA